MTNARRIAVQLALLLLAAMAVLLGDAQAAYAQAGTCQQLDATLATLERNADFRNATSTRNDARRLQRELQRTESQYVRGGCNDDAKAGRQLSSQCRSLARKITDGREQLAALTNSVDTAAAVDQQREAILQEMSRFDCNSRSSARVERQDRGNIFEQLFGALGGDGFDGEGGIRGDEFNPYGGYHTVRTLCVRKTDGFYWPISYSTLVDYVPNDAEACRAQCPTLDVDLYYYDNPGQEPEQMINQFGEPYTALPTAFLFRTQFDTVSRCASTQDVGQVTLAQLDGGRTRAMISFRGATFPLPLRDPRQIAPTVVAVAEQVVDTAQYVDVPLPRRRPSAPGEAPVAVAVPVAPVASSEPQRVVQFGGKRVRIVGPDTPYARVAGAGT